MNRKILLVVVEVGAARSRCHALHTGFRDPKEGGSDEFQDHDTDIDAQESLFKLRTTFTVHRGRRPLVRPMDEVPARAQVDHLQPKVSSTAERARRRGAGLTGSMVKHMPAFMVPTARFLA